MEALGAVEVVKKIRTLEIKFSDLEDNVLSHGNYLEEIELENEEDRKDVEKLKERVSHVEWDLEPGLSRLDVFKRVSKLEENFSCLENRVGELEDQQGERIKQLENIDREYEEKFRVLTLQNNELRDHLNMTIDTVNNITTYLNNVLEQQQQQQQQRDDEVTSNEVTCEKEEEEEDEPLTLSQVYDLYQSQPRDEEAWQEMTNAIKAAQEYEKQKQQDTIINGLSKDEWKDFLGID